MRLSPFVIINKIQAETLHSYVTASLKWKTLQLNVIYRMKTYRITKQVEGEEIQDFARKGRKTTYTWMV
jgi:branched-subunit amino acid transport protein AzlD